MSELIIIALILGMLVLVPLAIVLVVLFILKRRQEPSNRTNGADPPR
jgi:hypothetical protein